jgi:hypothetical protein
VIEKKIVESQKSDQKYLRCGSVITTLQELRLGYEKDGYAFK